MSISSDPVTYAVQSILSNGIDKTVLQLAYGGVNSSGVKRNIAHEVEKVIIKNVCNDFNLISGDIIDIAVGDCKMVESSDARVYIVPAIARRNRDIREVLSLKKKTFIHNNGFGSDAYPVTGNSLIDGMSTTLNSMSSSVPTGNTFVELEDDNTIRVTSSDGSFYGYDTFVVDIENRDRLKKLKKGSYKLFSKIVTTYIKSHIYSNRIAINKASIYGGHEISEISSVISEFSGAGEEYDVLVEENAGKMLLYSDESKLNSLYQWMV